jgi:ankyrin repeat protein
MLYVPAAVCPARSAAIIVCFSFKDSEIKMTEVFRKLCNKATFQRSDDDADPWQELEQWMEENMSNRAIITAAANFKTNDNNTPLHLVVRSTNYPPPLALVEKLIELAPGSLQTRNKDGNLPLHIACKKSGQEMPSDLVRLLLQAYPGGAQVKSKSKQLPLHQACQRSASHQVVSDLVQIYPRASQVKGNEARLPLHFAMISNASLETINLLIEANPTALKSKDRWGVLPSFYFNKSCVPLHCLHKAICCCFSIHLVNLLLEFLPEERLKKDTYGMLPLHHACQSSSPYYHDYIETLLNTDKKCLLTQISTKDYSQRLPLHRLSTNSNAVPKSLLQQMVDFYPESVTSRDKYGMIPFHYASLNPSTTVELLMYFILYSPAEVILPCPTKRKKNRNKKKNRKRKRHLTTTHTLHTAIQPNTSHDNEAV